MTKPNTDTPKAADNNKVVKRYAINLLYDAFSKSNRHKPTSTSLTIFATAFLFILMSIAIFVFGTIYLNTIKTRNKLLKQRLKKLTPTIELIYNISLRKQYLSEGQNPHYSPADIIRTLNLVITPEGHITSYQLNSQGDINVRITTDSTYKAASIWLYLIANKQIITQLNLHSFTFDTENNTVDFTLRGKLDIKKISKGYANETR